ncbi:polymer-forming cytoskeletal protein [Erwinia sp. JUb26]|uniref:bactofilin family protein n=1 Tax=Erwinia sp. JUb26 TaxID=2485126 RepID=UPI000F482689|nr:polymer-forming cytoskeletal protein [Erwinia sp. JUb26]ROR03461.1 cytoskeletal protein CcmA (bactofilin family) [Erwinia sp. JUb26]
MFQTRKHDYLWGIWTLWTGSIIAFLLSHRLSMLIFLSGMGCLILFRLSSYLRVNRVIINMFNFSKKEGVQTADKLASSTSTMSENINVDPSAESHNIKETTISPGTTLRGEIINENNITISGEVEGDVTSKKTTQIGKEGTVIGKVTSFKLVVNGLLKGCCYAKTVVIMSRGRIEGDVYASEFSIEKGGVFIGNSHWVEETCEIKDKKAKNSNSSTPERSPSLVPVDGSAVKNNQQQTRK